MSNHLLKHPLSFLPIVLPLFFCGVIIITISTQGLPDPNIKQDEGLWAHLFQLWLVVQFFLIIAFSLKYLLADFKKAWWILLLQLVATLAAVAPVFYLKF